MNEKFKNIVHARKDITQAIKENKMTAKADSHAHKETGWPAYDSLLFGAEKENRVSFGLTFLPCLPEEYASHLGDDTMLKKYIENTLTKGGTAVEFGGPGSKLFKGFSDGFFRETIGVCLKDIRSVGKKLYDEIGGHFVIEGDILNVENNPILLDQVKERLRAEKTDLIISRMMGGLLGTNRNPAILDRVIRNWYEMLNENGLMFIQFEFMYSDKPLPIQNVVEKWARAVTKDFPEIEIQVERDMLRLHKKKGSPDNLPPATQL